KDDSVLHDPYFFWKLAWFNARFGKRRVLLPYRYERGAGAVVDKLYLDATVTAFWTQPHHDFSKDRVLEAKHRGHLIRFRPATNPHSGCFFLSAAQFEYWASRPYYLDRDASFIGPMESAASLGI